MLLLGELERSWGATIATCNVRNWSGNSRTDSEVGAIRVLLERYDLVGLQEVLDVAAVDELIGQLGPGWGRVVSAQVGTNKMERMAFLYRTATFGVVESWLYADGKSASFEREPFCAHLRAASAAVGDLVVCTIHVVFGDSLAPRRAELRALADVMAAAEARVPGAAPVLMGDFNMPPHDGAWGDLQAAGYRAALEDAAYRTTIGDVSLYDNIWYTSVLPLGPTAGAPYVLEFDELMFPTRDVASRVVSDHRPVSLLLGSSPAPPPGPPNSRTAGTSGFAGLPRGGLGVGAWGAVSRTTSPWAADDGAGPAATLAQHFDVLAFVGDSASVLELSLLAGVLADEFQAGAYVAEHPFLYSVGAAQRSGAQFTVAAGAATCAVFVSNTAEVTLCALGAGATAAIAETAYTEAVGSPSARGHVLVAGSFDSDVAGAAFDGVREAGAVSLVDTTGTSRTDGTGQLRDTLFGPAALAGGATLLDGRVIPFDEWFYAPATAAVDARELSRRRPVRILLENGGGFTAAPNCHLFFSKYIEGESWNKALELYNPSDSPVPLEYVSLGKINNGGSTWAEATFLDLGAGVLGAGQTLVVAHPSADQVILDAADILLGGMTFTGNDAVGIACDGQMVDVVGVESEVVTDGWRVGDTPAATQDAVLVRKPHVQTGVGEDWAAAAGDSRHNAEYDVLHPASGDNLLGLGSHYADPTILGRRTTTLLISEYLEANVGFNKAVELFNPTDTYTDLAGYGLVIAGRNAGAFGTGAGVLAPRDTYTLAHPRADSAVLARADATDGALNFNGDDAVVLAVDGGQTVVDCVGDPLAPPASGDGYDVADVADATVDHTLVRKPTVAFPNGGGWARSASTDSPSLSEWDVRPISSDTLGSHQFDAGEGQFCTLYLAGRQARRVRGAQAGNPVDGGTPEQTPYCCGSDANCPANSYCDESKSLCMCDEGRDGDSDCTQLLDGVTGEDTGSPAAPAPPAASPSPAGAPASAPASAPSGPTPVPPPQGDFDAEGLDVGSPAPAPSSATTVSRALVPLTLLLAVATILL